MTTCIKPAVVAPRFLPSKNLVNRVKNGLLQALLWLLASVTLLGLSVSAQAQTNDAVFVSQSVPVSMTTGQTYAVSVTMQNTGTTTWSAASGYKLGSQNPENNLNWVSSGRVELATSVAPGQSYTFNFNVTAPATAGTYNFQWRMLQEGVSWLGGFSTNVGVTVSAPSSQGNAATFVSQSVPTAMTAGQSYAVSVTMQNTGSTTWSAATNYRLGSQNPENNATWVSTARVNLAGSVAPGQSTTFTFNVTAPASAGNYNFQWKMVQENVGWFGPLTPNIAVTVSPPGANAASFVSQSVPSTMTAGQNYSVSVTLQNTGATTWSAANNYKLGSQNPENNAIWVSTSRVALANSVAPGQQYAFTFNVTAPSTLGTYNFQWRMVQENIGWFGATSPNVAVTTSGATPTPIAAPPPSATRTSAFVYDAANGLLTREIIEPNNTQLRVESAYTYDAFGNKTSVTVSSPATGNAAIVTRISSVGFDARGQFQISATNALNHVESVNVDAKFGTPLSTTDSNGQTTQFTYDSFGRKILEVRPDQTRTKFEYRYCSAVIGSSGATCPTYAAYVVQATPLAADNTTPNGPWKKAYFDTLDREIKTETQSFNYATVVNVSNEYDSLGRLARSSRPYFDGDTPQWTNFTYDALDRVIVTTAADNTQTRVAYNGLSTTTTNALNQAKTRVTNSQQQMVSNTDAAGNQIRYDYDAFGNLWKTTDPKGNNVFLAYDARGRKIKMADPDTGIWNYSYDALGQMVSQTDAKGQVITITYDKLGRVARRAEPDLISAWTYDSCVKGVGRLCKAESDNGYSRTLSYDTLARVVRVDTQNGALYSEIFGYDSNGRVQNHTLPGGLQLTYSYLLLGSLKEIRRTGSNQLYWQLSNKDAEGRITYQTYGNNIVTRQVYQESTGRLTAIQAGINGNNSVQNAVYNYDAIGNLTLRSDDQQTFAETFLYDNLNRLTSATVNGNAGLVTQTLSYDNIGNIVSRSGLGAYTYGAVNNLPHAVNSIAIASGGRRQYLYDANGNLTNDNRFDASGASLTAQNRSVTYTSFNMAKTLTGPGGSVSFVYGPEHQRLKETTATGTTFYVHPDSAGGLRFERETKTDGTYENRWYLNAGEQAFAIIKQSASGETINYLHRDQLGSTTAITNQAGQVIERLAYEPFGKRRLVNGLIDANNTLAGINTDRGYTNHEHIDGLGLINMNGRIYDPTLGRFMSADPIVQASDNLQSYNRYAYVMNSPFMYTDPSGFSWWTRFRDKVLKPVIAIAVSVFVPVLAEAAWASLGVSATAIVSAQTVGAIAGGFAGAYVGSGGDLRSGLTGAVTAGLFNFAGDAPGELSAGRLVGHAIAGCVSGQLQGSGCGKGAASAVVGQIVPNVIGGGFISSIVAGGVASAVGGGKFVNGALTAAYGYLFNDLAHEREAQANANAACANGMASVSCSQALTAVDKARQETGREQALEGSYPIEELVAGSGAAKLVRGFAPAVLEELGPAGSIFGRTKLGGSSFFNINANDVLRIGWGWKGSAQTGNNVFRISGDWVRSLGVQSGHIDLFTVTPK